jgi:hypothetical protein
MRSSLLLVMGLLLASELSWADEAAPKINALLQTWAVGDDSNPAGSTLNFRIRRAEIKLSGSLVEKTRYFVMVDPAKSLSLSSTGTLSATNDNKILQDIGVGFSPVANFEILMGQFKTPTTAEGLTSSGELLLPERSLSGRTFGDKRRPGLMVSYTDESLGKLSAMVSNGQNTNVDAGPNTKDLNLRYEVKPLSFLKVGAFVVLGDFKYDRKGTMGANAEVTWEDLIIGGEYATGRDSGVLSHGFETHLAYSLTAELQAVVRFDLYQANKSAAFAGKMETLGLNYNLVKNKVRIMTAVSSLQNINGGANGSPSASSLSNGKNSTLVISAFQMAL